MKGAPMRRLKHAGWATVHRFIHPVSLGALMLWLFLFQAPCFASDPTNFEGRLQTAIEQAQRELEAEKTRIQKELQAREEELQRVRAECKTLADEIVERKFAIAEKQGTLREIRKQRETLWTERTQFQEELAQVKAICRDVETELSELLDILPISEHRPNQRQQLAILKASLDQEAVGVMVPSVFELVESLLRESRTSAVYPAEILDSQGRRQTARLLRVGQSLFAYHIPGTSRTAIAISDPYQQGGFRWYEGLSADMQQAIVGAVNQLENRDGIYALPVDVTGTMTAATDLSGKSLQGRFRSGGIVMFPLAIVALWLAVLIVERLFILLRESRHSLQFCEQILDLCSAGDFDKAERLANKRKGIVSRILQVCLANRHQPPSVLDDAIQEAFLHELPRLERFLPSMRMLSAVAPMLGLLGTVTGIIATFDMITVVGGGKPRLLAGGISEALITTATGLAIAIPGLLAHSFLSSRIEGLIADAERFAASLSNVLKQKPATSPSKGGATGGTR
jgi:biopolymer transport protein ExbB